MGHVQGAASRPLGTSRSFRSAAVAALTGLTLTLSVVTAGAAAEPVPPARETVAALDPALTAGRGATVPFVEQEAENVATNGTIIGYDTTAYTLAAEASGRKAVRLTAAGQFVEFTLTRPANAITVRYSIPDAPNGGGIDAPITLTVNGKKARTITLTSKYSWLYNQYSFSNDPNAGPIHPDWWIAERDDPGSARRHHDPPFRPMHFYDEQRILLGHDHKAGDRVRLTVPQGSNAAWTVIDLMDFEQVAPPAGAPKNSLSVLAFGADRTGKRDSADAFDAAVDGGEGRRQDRVHPGRDVPGEPPHRRRRRDDPGCRQLVVDRPRHGGHPGRAAPRRFDPHRRRFLRQGRGRRRQQQRPPVRLRHRRRRPRAHRHRPGQWHRWRDERLDDRAAVHPPHQGRALVRRPDGRPVGPRHDRRRCHRRRGQLPARRHELRGRQQLLP